MGLVRRHHHGAGVLQDVGHLLIVQLGVERHHRNARAGTGQIDIHPFGAVGENLRHVLLPWLEAKLGAIGLSRGFHVCEEFPVGAPNPSLTAPKDLRHMVRMLDGEFFKS